MKYDWLSKNYGKDLIYETRLKLARKLKINKQKSPKFYSYIMAAEIGIILM